MRYTEILLTLIAAILAFYLFFLNLIKRFSSVICRMFAMISFCAGVVYLFNLHQLLQLEIINSLFKVY